MNDKKIWEIQLNDKIFWGNQLNFKLFEKICSKMSTKFEQKVNEKLFERNDKQNILKTMVNTNYLWKSVKCQNVLFWFLSQY